MAIIAPIFSMSTLVGKPFCDFLNISVPCGAEMVGDPLSDLVASELAPLLETVGYMEVAKGLFKTVGKDTGSFKYGQMGPVGVIGASGQLLDVFRSAGLFRDYLTVFSDRAHRVTMLHVAADYAVEGPVAFRAVRRRGLRGEISLTRKCIDRQNVRLVQSLNAAGKLTGTVYLGNRANADVWARVYDKREERVSRGFPDPGPLVRVELVVSGVGATLRDVSDPSELFYHYASPSLVEGPVGGSEWVGGAVGYVLPARVPILPYQRIEGILSGSPDMTRICAIARKGFGDAWVTHLVNLFRAHCLLGDIPSAKQALI